jgi:hypothetical protein
MKLEAPHGTERRFPEPGVLGGKTGIRRAETDGNSNCRWPGRIIVVDQAVLVRPAVNHVTLSRAYSLATCLPIRQRPSRPKTSVLWSMPLAGVAGSAGLRVAPVAMPFGSASASPIS